MGVFPNFSRNVPFCPRLSSFVPICPCSGPQEGQKRTNGDKTGHFGTNWETPPFSIYPHLALLKICVPATVRVIVPVTVPVPEGTLENKTFWFSFLSAR